MSSYHLDPAHESFPQTLQLLVQLGKLVPVEHDPFAGEPNAAAAPMPSLPSSAASGWGYPNP